MLAASGGMEVRLEAFCEAEMDENQVEFAVGTFWLNTPSN